MNMEDKKTNGKIENPAQHIMGFIESCKKEVITEVQLAECIDYVVQTYAEQEACLFNVWSRDEALYIGDDQWAYNDSFYGTQELFKIWKDETGK